VERLRASHVAVVWAFWSAGCAGGKSTLSPDDTLLGETEASDTLPEDRDSDAVADDLLARVHTPEVEAASRGEASWAGGALSRPLIPTVALDTLWLTWGRVVPPPREALIAGLVERYGFVPSSDATAWPVGIVQLDAEWTSLDCQVCHTGVVAGQVVEGLANSTLDLERLYTDLIRLGEIAEGAGLPVVEVPWTLEGFTAAPGTHDAFGLGIGLSTLLVPIDVGVNTTYGFQQAPALWTLPFKRLAYTDGGGSTDSYRTMAAMPLAFGGPPADLDAYDAQLADLQHRLWSIPVPAWPFAVPHPAEVARGRDTFVEHCAACHGRYEGDIFPDTVVDVGTDPLRHERFGPLEVTWVNASWYADVPMRDTEGYLAPPLLGVWATAPYLHNGSVPDLASLLDPPSRPSRWRRTGVEEGDYDVERVGWRVEIEPVAGANVYDTSLPGLSSAGHQVVVPEPERADLLSFLRTL
jgi:hypothetical protein